MKITFLGSGSAFSTENFQSNMLIESNGERMLFDCGGDIRWSLKEKGLSLSDIDAVYVSHLHADHTGGLEGLAFIKYFSQVIPKGLPKPNLYGNTQVINDLWDSTLKGGLQSIQMIDANLDTFFNVHRVPNNDYFLFGSYKYNDCSELSCKLVQSIHVVADCSLVKSFGLFITVVKVDEGSMHVNSRKKVYITSDTQFAPSQIKDFIKSADVVFHDCETVPVEYASGVHAHYEELKSLPEEMKAKMWLYHWNGSYEKLPDAKADGFLGFVKKGQEFEI
jgi:ribonuclease BN (tRNA processing enzyme)